MAEDWDATSDKASPVLPPSASISASEPSFSGHASPAPTPASELTLPDPLESGLLETPDVSHAKDRAVAANFKNIAISREQLAESGYRRLSITGRTFAAPSEEASACSKLRRAITLRAKWACSNNRIPVPVTLDPHSPDPAHPAHPAHPAYSTHPAQTAHPRSHSRPSQPEHNSNPESFAKSDHVCHWLDGVMQVYPSSKDLMRRSGKLQYVPSWIQFVDDFAELVAIVNDPEVRSLSYRRLVLLEGRFNLHLLLNESSEKLEQVMVPHRDFYNVRKVDTHVHHSSCMNAKHLLRFIKAKLKEHPDDVVLPNRDDPSKPPLTLQQVFDSLNLSAHELSVDTLDVHADTSTFQRFDRFNLKYNPIGQSRLREIFMKTNNFIKGRYLAELTHQVFADLEETKYQNAEYRISIYGKSPDEWDLLGAWIADNKLYSNNVRWLIQIPRLYHVYRTQGAVESFQDMLDHIFTPLFEVTIDPTSHPQLFETLQYVVGFDSVDDESAAQPRFNLRKMCEPEKWTGEENPPYSYYSFYIATNLRVLNRLRSSRGMSTFTYRPHAGEAGDIDNLASCFLLADGINHGLNLRKSPGLQYLYYVTQVGIAMSPLSNNRLFVEYTKNPLPTYFKQGMNVSLSTDDPLQFHFTREPLMEEYSVAAQVWKFSSCDLGELAKNSVLQSGFEAPVKSYWLGSSWYKFGPDGNDITRTNVPSIRIKFRTETLQEELAFVFEGNVPTDSLALPNFMVEA